MNLTILLKRNRRTAALNPLADEVQKLIKSTRRIIFVVFGVTLLLIGIALLVLPGPGIPIILVALGMLGAEFAWARWLLGKVKKKAKGVMSQVNHMMKKSEATDAASASHSNRKPTSHL